jgi:hypothetical protein
MTQKEKRAGAEAKRNIKPFLNIRMLEPVKKSFSISKEADSMLQSYIHFYNDINNEKKYTEGSVIEALIGTLSQDKEFFKWYSNNPLKQDSIKLEEEKTI